MATALLLPLFALSLVQQANVGAAPPPPKDPTTWYLCGNPHCYGRVQWNGATLGTATYMYVQPLTCSDCTPSNGQHLNVETWLDDENTGGYIEVGYGARDQENGAEWYFWSNTPPGQSQTRHEVGAVPSGDYYNYTGFKLTRNRQPTNTILLQIWSANFNYGVGAFNSMGTSTYAGTIIATGSELVGTNLGGNIFQSTNGYVFWINNQWQYSSGLYSYQTVDGAIQNDGPEYQTRWLYPPSQSPTGGDLQVSCGC